MDTNPNTKNAAAAVKPVDKPESQASAKKTEPEVLISTLKLDLSDCESIYIVVPHFGLSRSQRKKLQKRRMQRKKRRKLQNQNQLTKRQSLVSVC